MDRISIKLFQIIRASLNVGTSDLTLTFDECEMLIKICEKQSILPIFYVGLKKLKMPNEILKLADQARSRDIRRFVLFNDAIINIYKTLDKAGIDYIPLKGAMIRNLYPEPEMRTCADIDVLVREEMLDEAVKVIETNTDFKARKRNYHDVSMVNSNVHLELHFSIKENMDNIDKTLQFVWDYAIPDEQFRYVLTPEFQIFHIIAHMSYHMVNGGLGIRPFLDLWLLRNKTNYDEKLVRSMCLRCNILTFYEKCSELVDLWMSGSMVNGNLKALETYALNGGVFGNRNNAIATKQRNQHKISYIFQRIFLKREYLVIEFPELKEKPYLIAICQIKRWARLLDSNKRNKVESELHSLISLNQQTISSFDDLLTNLGL